ncbi:hypothetical protein V5O48_001850 [Marasmius crinis-equi]|uniref:F-box domain-containing protein n=1 Tax=Marasmius crinis-equi TaxID=585013 RepID=A0ABR3FYE4_9AGAR
MKLVDIPYDVWTEIVKHTDPPTLRMLQLTSSALYRLACPILYQQLVYCYGTTALQNESFWSRILSEPSSNVRLGTRRLSLPISLIVTRSVMFGPHRSNEIHAPANVFPWSTILPITRYWECVVSLTLQNIVIQNEFADALLQLPALECLALTNVSIPVNGTSTTSDNVFLLSPKSGLKRFVLRGPVRGDVDDLDRVWSIVKTIFRLRSLRSVKVDVEALPSMARIVSLDPMAFVEQRECCFRRFTVVDDGRVRSGIWTSALFRILAKIGAPLEQLIVLSLADLVPNTQSLSFASLRTFYGPVTLLLSLHSTTVQHLAEIVATETVVDPLQFIKSLSRRCDDALRELRILKLNVVAMDDKILMSLCSMAPGLVELYLESEYEDLSTIVGNPWNVSPIKELRWLTKVEFFGFARGLRETQDRGTTIWLLWQWRSEHSPDLSYVRLSAGEAWTWRDKMKMWTRVLERANTLESALTPDFE